MDCSIPLILYAVTTLLRAMDEASLTGSIDTAAVYRPVSDEQQAELKQARYILKTCKMEWRPFEGAVSAGGSSTATKPEIVCTNDMVDICDICESEQKHLCP